MTAGDIELPPFVEVIDDSQYIATTTRAMSPDIELRIEKDRGYRIEDLKGYEDGESPIDAVFMSVRNVNYSVHPFRTGKEVEEILFIEIWTNGSSTPNEALCEASKNLINLFIPFIRMTQEDISHTEDSKTVLDSTEITSPLNNIDESTGGIAFKQIFIDQLELPARTYNCLKQVNIHTISDLLNYSQEDLQRIKNFGKKSVDQVSKALWERFAIDSPRNRSYANWKKIE